MFKFKKFVSALSVGLGIYLGIAPTANAYDTITVLGGLGGTNSAAFGINDSGQVVGYGFTAGNASSQAVLWNGTTPTALGGLGGTSSFARGINNLGQIVGYGSSANGTTVAALWNGTTPTVLGGLAGVTNSYALGVNNSGQISGYGFTQTSSGALAFSAILWNGTTPTLLNNGLPTCQFCAPSAPAANAINNSGQVVGQSNGSNGQALLWSSTNNPTYLGWGYANAINNSGQVVGVSNSQATVWNGTTTSILGGLGGSFGSVAQGINNAGQVVGVSYTTGNAAYHGMLWSMQNGVWVATDLNTLIAPTLGFTIQSATAINNQGQVVGYGVNGLGQRSAFVMSVAPVPEPSEWLLMLCGLGLMGFIATRRKNDTQNMMVAT